MIKKYLTKDFDYSLPKEFIANSPANPRDTSKLMIFDSSLDKIHHKKFHEIDKFFKKGDVLVINRSKVIPARILFFFNDKLLEIFILKKLKNNVYNVLVKPGKFFKKGGVFNIKKDLKVSVIDILEDGTRSVEFYSKSKKNIDNVIEKLGTVPLPPYIENHNIKFSQYQTIYAKEKGSVAAPTAGFHFTTKLLKRLKDKGVIVISVLLHVGRGTFLPVKTDFIEDHKMHEEFFSISKKNASILNLAKKEKRRIIAVGTTSVRVLESSFDVNKNSFIPQIGETAIYIYPGKYKWKAVNCLVTNFHLPKSTLIMLVASFLEHKKIKNPVKKILNFYELAKQKKYRFYSFGDAMFLF